MSNKMCCSFRKDAKTSLDVRAPFASHIVRAPRKTVDFSESEKTIGVMTLLALASKCFWPPAVRNQSVIVLSSDRRERHCDLM